MLAEILFFSLIGTARADQIGLKISSSATISHLWRNDEHFKLFKCWGGNGDIDVWMNSESGKAETYEANSGSTDHVYKAGRRAGFADYVPQRLKWKGELTPNRDLTIEFSQVVQNAQTNKLEHACSTQTFHSLLDGVFNTVAVNARIHIPEGVWMIRVKKTENANTSNSHNPVTTNIVDAEPVEVDGANVRTSYVSYPIDIEVGEYQYMFVRPESEIQIKVDWETQEKSTLAWKEKFEIRLMGEDTCFEHFGDPSKLTNSELKAALQKALAPETLKANPHVYIEKIACLRSQAYIHALLQSNHARDLVETLATTTDKFSSYADHSSKYYDAVWASTQMTLLEVSRTLLQDLSRYCDVTEFKDSFGLAKEITIKMRQYTYAAIIYDKIRFHLDGIPEEMLISYVDFLKSLESSGVTYAQAAKVNRPNLDQFHDTLYDHGFGDFDEIRSLMAGFPETQSGAGYRASSRQLLAATEQARNEMSDQLRASFLKFRDKRNEIVSTRDISSAVENYFQQLSAARSMLEADFGWLLQDGKVSATDSGLLRDLERLDIDVLGSSLDALQRNMISKLNYQNPRVDFLKIEKTKKLKQNIYQCLRRNNA